jgi:flagellar export protein FliJ
MAFHFTLNGLLRLRESLEKAELQRLQAMAAAVARMRAELESLEETMNAARRRAADAVSGAGMTGAELQFEISREAAWNVLRREVQKRLADLEQKRKEQQARYMQVRMQREIVSNLYQRQLAEYQLEESRRAQQRVDELFLIRSIPTAVKAAAEADDEVR